MTMVTHAVIDCVVDYGASNHTTSSADNLISVRPPLPTDPSSIVVGNTALPGLFYHNNVLVTPDIIQNLLFVHHFTTNN
jgi:hypothetical protein